MKTKLFFLCAVLTGSLAMGQSNYTATLPNSQEARNMYGLICCFYKISVATDAAGNAYVLSELPSDSSMWVTKYDFNGNLIYNTRVGVLGYETNYHYAAKKIRAYDRVYVLSRTYGPIGNNPNYWESETVYTLDKNTGVVDQLAANFVAVFGNTNAVLIDLVASGNTINMIGQVTDASGHAKIEVMRSDLTWTGNIYVKGNDPGTDYLLNTESTCFSYYNGAVYMTGQTSGGSGNNIFIARLDVWGFYSEYVYHNSAYTNGAKGLSVATEGNAVYVSGSMRPSTGKPFKTTVIKIDTALTAPVWVSINKNSVWPLAIQLAGNDVIYTVDFTLQVVGFSKSTGNQLFAKNDFRNYSQVYNQPLSTAVLNNNQLFIQASVGVKVGGNATINKVTAKYSTSGMKVYQQLESLSTISPGNPGSAEALGMAYSPGANYITEVYRKTSSAGNLIYVNGKASPNSLRIAQEPEANAELLSVYPNPAKESFTIRSSGNISSWILYDMTMRKAASGEQAGNEMVVDCRSFRSGLYFLSIRTEEGETVTSKVMIR